MKNLALIASLLQATLTYSSTILVDNGGPWGDWGSTEKCPPGTMARGFSLLVEPPQGNGDDTALNGVKLYCARRSSRKLKATITSARGSWGTWTSVQWCPSGGLINFSLKVEAPIGDGDDTAANNIMFQCSDYTVLRGYGERWGTFGPWSDICHEGICGIRTKLEAPQGNGDDTALNDVRFLCCYN
ncbi:vitelline membrane outer layer protein 1 homolog [Hyperolius riggenbachi]|uniref:vitelline membrane outer layer protein 1 homolog n=1 Tax=Hyperolius riggenbachi TaxID=752182 RepID=UPI0035A2C5E8